MADKSKAPSPTKYSVLKFGGTEILFLIMYSFGSIMMQSKMQVGWLGNHTPGRDCKSAQLVRKCKSIHDLYVLVKRESEFQASCPL